MTLIVYGSTQGYSQVRQVTDYVSTTDTATVDTWTVTPSGTITYWLFATPPAVASGTLPSVTVGSGGITTASFAAGAINAAAIGADAITNAKIADDAIAAENLATGALTADAFAANAIVAATFAADAITAAKVAADVGVEIAAAVLTAAAADPIDANIEQINTVAVTGNGVSPKFGV